MNRTLLDVRQARIFGAILSLGLGAPLLAYAAAGWFSRYAADDFCTAGQVRAAGFVRAQSLLYVDWSGRFAATFMVTLAELAGSFVVEILPALALVAWWAAITLAVIEITGSLGWRLGRVSSGILAALLIYATLQTTADLQQVVYWQTGIVTYLLPLVFATLYAAWLARLASGRTAGIAWPGALALSFGIAFMAGGTSETFAAVQVTALSLASALALIVTRRSPVSVALLAGLAGALVALVVIAVAPGNEVRQQTSARAPITVALPDAVEFTRGWLRLTFARPHADVLLLLFGVPAAVAANAHRARSNDQPWGARPALIIAFGIVACGLVILAAMVPAFYALGSNPPGRAQLIPQYVLICAIAAVGWLVGALTGPRLIGFVRGPALAWGISGALVLLLVVGPLLTAERVLSQAATSARSYASAWDQVDQQIRSDRVRGLQDITVPALASTGNVQDLDFYGPDRHDWLNECVARYYDAGSIAAQV
jgi:hypothetical protein